MKKTRVFADGRKFLYGNIFFFLLTSLGGHAFGQLESSSEVKRGEIIFHPLPATSNQSPMAQIPAQTATPKPNNLQIKPEAKTSTNGIAFHKITSKNISTLILVNSEETQIPEGIYSVTRSHKKRGLVLEQINPEQQKKFILRKQATKQRNWRNQKNSTQNQPQFAGTLYLEAESFKALNREIRRGQHLLISRPNTEVPWEQETFTDLPHRQQLMATVANWQKSWAEADWPNYAGFYHNNFRGEGLNQAAWLKLKRKIFKNQHQPAAIELTPLFEAQINNMWLLVFEQKYYRQSRTETGLKQMIWQQDPKGFFILHESWHKTKPSNASFGISNLVTTGNI